MKLVLRLCIVFFILTSCGSGKPKINSASTSKVSSSSDHTPFFDITEYAKDKDYGLTGEKPVKVGEMSVQNQVRYLASLAGPNGEELTFKRKGACCAYDSDAAPFGSAMVDVYEVTYQGLKKPILIYISFYDYETLYIPKGFIKRL